MNDSSPHPDRQPESGRSQGEEALEVLRRDIDQIDEQIVDLLARRLAKVQSVVAIKKSAGLPIYHPAREENLSGERRRANSGEIGSGWSRWASFCSIS